jgi:RNA recognition motif-containing protein
VATNCSKWVEEQMKLFVSGFFQLATVSEIAELFEGCGKVTSVRLKKGEKRAYAIVEMSDDFGAERAIQELDGTVWEGRTLEVSESKW